MDQKQVSQTLSSHQIIFTIIADLNGTMTGFYDCHLNYSAAALYSRGNPSSLAASIVGIVILLVTVAYVW